MEVANDPVVRNALRRVFQDDAVLNTEPTPKGLLEVDPMTPLARTKYLKNVPINELINACKRSNDADDMESDLFLYVNSAAKHGFITYTITPRSDVGVSAGSVFDGDNAIAMKLNEIKTLYNSTAAYDTTYWGPFRDKVVELAYTKYLRPRFVNELIVQLSTKAQEAAISKCVTQLQSSLIRAPFTPLAVSDEVNLNRSKFPSMWRIMALVPGESMQAPVCVAVLNGHGDVIELNKLHYLLVFESSNPNPDQPETESRKHRNASARDAKRTLEGLIVKYQPEAIVIGTRTLSVCQDMNSTLEHMFLSIKADNEQFKVHKGWCDITIPYRVAVTKTLERAMPDVAEDLRVAVCVGRMFLDPLVEYANMMDYHRTMLEVSLHPLTNDMDKERLYNSYVRLFVNAVSERGVDVSRALRSPHHLSCLQFVPGLGPRKAQGLITKISGSVVCTV